MIRLRSAATAVGAAAVLCVAPSLSAQAATSAQTATGSFYYSDTNGATYYITNPPPGACLGTPDAISARNDTDQTVRMYDSSDCSGLAYTVKRGENFSGNFNSAST